MHDNPPLQDNSIPASLPFKVTSYLCFRSESAEISNALLIFNSETWSQRCTFFKTTGVLDHLSSGDASRRLARAAGLAYATQLSTKRSGFGKAGSRTDEQASAACRFANHKLSLVAPRGAVAFTDGASRGNPGPSGAGCLLSIVGDPTTLLEAYAALGHGTNNTSELWAIGMALELATRLPPSGRPYPLTIFTDSTYSIDCLQGSSVARTNGFLVYRIRSLKDRLIASGIIGSLHLSWVPGHAGLPGNTQADFLANRGAEASQLGKRVLDLPRCLELLIFVPD